MTEKRQTSQGYIIRILQHFATKLRNITNFVDALSSCDEIFVQTCLMSRSKFHSKGERSIVSFANLIYGQCMVVNERSVLVPIITKRRLIRMQLPQKHKKSLRSKRQNSPSMDHSPINQNFDLNISRQNSTIA